MEEKKITYQIHCRTCRITYQSDVPAVVGQPCPNPHCPRGNPIIGEVWWQRKWVKVVAVAGGLGVLGILLFDVGGWGTFVLDLALSFLVQVTIALILFGMLLAIFLIAFGKALRPFLSRHVLLGMFLLAAVLTLPLVAAVFRRRVDIYDVIMAIVLGIAANLLTKPLERFLEK
jgi:hypothetical protein